jgi:hypothetical protein
MTAAYDCRYRRNGQWTNTSGAFGIDGATGKASNLRLDNGSQFTVLGNGSADNTTVGAGSTLNVAQGGTLTGTTSFGDGASLTGSATNSGQLHFSTGNGQGAAISGSVSGEGQLLRTVTAPDGQQRHAVPVTGKPESGYAGAEQCHHQQRHHCAVRYAGPPDRQLGDERGD